MQSLVTLGTKHRPPHFIDQIGEDGITSIDLAEALDVRHSNVTAKLRRINKSRWISNGWNYTTILVKFGNRGRPTVCYLLSKSAAKVTLAQWGNPRGEAYFAFLMRREDDLLNQLPKLHDDYLDERKRREAAELRCHDMARQLAQLQERPKHLRSPVKTVCAPVSFHTQPSLFKEEPEEIVIRYKMVPVDVLTEKQRDMVKRHTITSTLGGLTRSMKRLDEKEMTLFDSTNLPVPTRDIN